MLAKNVRLEAAVHIINTLKSVNDRSLSDWQGVIGDEISAQREVQEEREEMLRDLLERFDSLQHATLRAAEVHHDTGQEPLYSEVASIRSELRLLASQISGIPVTPSRVPKRKEVQKPCPNCGQVLQYRQKPKAKNARATDCTKCGARLLSKEADGDFALTPRVPVDENVTCHRADKTRRFWLIRSQAGSWVPFAPSARSDLGLVAVTPGSERGSPDPQKRPSLRLWQMSSSRS